MDAICSDTDCITDLDIAIKILQYKFGADEGMALYRQLKQLLHNQFLREAERAAEEKSKFRKIIDKITARW